MLIWMAKTVEIGEVFEFLGTGDEEDLVAGEVISLWTDRANGGLGHEIIWGSATVIGYIGNDMYRAKRFL